MHHSIDLDCMRLHSQGWKFKLKCRKHQREKLQTLINEFCRAWRKCSFTTNLCRHWNHTKIKIGNPLKCIAVLFQFGQEQCLNSVHLKEICHHNFECFFYYFSSPIDVRALDMFVWSEAKTVGFRLECLMLNDCRDFPLWLFQTMVREASTFVRLNFSYFVRSNFSSCVQL